MYFILKGIFVASLGCLAVVIFAFTIGQIIPVEFTDLDDRNRFYDFGYYAIPTGVLLTLTGTIKGSDGRRRVAWKIVTTVFTSVVSIAILFAYLFTFGFGAWVDLETRFRAKHDRRVRIVEQLYDVGAFGYGGRRLVKAMPFTPWFNYIEDIDSAKLDRSQWIPVKEEGDITY